MCTKQFLILLFLLVLPACQLIDYHPYDGRVSSDMETDINRKNMKQIVSACQGKDTIRFALIGDTQRFFDETKEAVNHINTNKTIDFIIHTGDLIEFGTKKEFEWINTILSQLYMPYIVLIGNHDIIGYGEDVFRKIYGETNFSFIVNDIKFVCLNTNALEYNFPSTIPDFNFIANEQIDSLSHQRTIVIMHAPPFTEQFKEGINNRFQEAIKQFPSLLFCLHSHTHYFSIRDLFNDGISYYGCDSIEKRTYLLFTVTKDNYSYELIHF